MDKVQRLKLTDDLAEWVALKAADDLRDPENYIKWLILQESKRNPLSKSDVSKHQKNKKKKAPPEKNTDDGFWGSRRPWSTRRPTKPGWYWVYAKSVVFNEPEIHCFQVRFDGANKLIFDASHTHFLEIDRVSHWLGPLLMPEPPVTIDDEIGSVMVSENGH